MVAHDRGELRLVRCEGLQDVGQERRVLEWRDRERAEQAAALLEDDLQIDLGAGHLLAGGRDVDDEAVHHVGLVEEVGEARVLTEAADEVGPGQQAPVGVELPVEVARALDQRPLHPVQRVEEPADRQQPAVGCLQQHVESGRDRHLGAGKRVDTGEARPADALETVERARVGAEPRQHLHDVRGGGFARELRRLPDDVEPEQPAAALEEHRVDRREALFTPALAEEAEAIARRQDVVAGEMRDLDLAQRQILGRVGDERRSRGQRARPALGEEAAGLRRGDELDEAVALGGGVDEGARKTAVRSRRRRIPRPPGQQVLHQEGKDAPAVCAGPAHELGQRFCRDVDPRCGAEPPPGAPCRADKFRSRRRRVLEHGDAMPALAAPVVDAPAFGGPQRPPAMLEQMPGERERRLGVLDQQERPAAVQQDRLAGGQEPPLRRVVVKVGTVGRGHAAIRVGSCW